MVWGVELVDEGRDAPRGIDEANGNSPRRGTPPGASREKGRERIISAVPLTVRARIRCKANVTKARRSDKEPPAEYERRFIVANTSARFNNQWNEEVALSFSQWEPFPIFYICRHIGSSSRSICRSDALLQTSDISRTDIGKGVFIMIGRSKDNTVRTRIRSGDHILNFNAARQRNHFGK